MFTINLEYSDNEDFLMLLAIVNINGLERKHETDLICTRVDLSKTSSTQKKITIVSWVSAHEHLNNIITRDFGLHAGGTYLGYKYHTFEWRLLH